MHLLLCLFPITAMGAAWEQGPCLSVTAIFLMPRAGPATCWAMLKADLGHERMAFAYFRRGTCLTRAQASMNPSCPIWKQFSMMVLSLSPGVGPSQPETQLQCFLISLTSAESVTPVCLGFFTGKMAMTMVNSYPVGYLRVQ